jgi:hypothetical protein
MKMMTWVVLSGLLACGNKNTDTGMSEDNSLKISNVSVSSNDCDWEEDLADVLTVSVEEGAVMVSHENYQYSACVTLDVEVTMDGTSLNITYPSSGSECDCIDVYRLEYQIDNLTVGSYTLNVPGDISETVVIE